MRKRTLKSEVAVCYFVFMRLMGESVCKRSWLSPPRSRHRQALRWPSRSPRTLRPLPRNRWCSIWRKASRMRAGRAAANGSPRRAASISAPRNACVFSRPLGQAQAPDFLSFAGRAGPSGDGDRPDAARAADDGRSVERPIPPAASRAGEESCRVLKRSGQTAGSGAEQSGGLQLSVCQGTGRSEDPASASGCAARSSYRQAGPAIS